MRKLNSFISFLGTMKSGNSLLNTWRKALPVRYRDRAKDTAPEKKTAYAQISFSTPQRYMKWTTVTDSTRHMYENSIFMQPRRDC